MEFVLGRFSHFCIAIAYSNSTFCGAWTPSFCEFTGKLSKFQENEHTPEWITRGFRGVLVLLKVLHFLLKCAKTGSLGATESEVWIGNFNVKAWKTTEHKLHEICRSLKIWQNNGKQAHPRLNPTGGINRHSMGSDAIYNISATFWLSLICSSLLKPLLPTLPN